MFNAAGVSSTPVPLQFQGTAGTVELALNWAVVPPEKTETQVELGWNLDEAGPEFTKPSSSVVPPSSSVVPPSSSVVPNSEPGASEFRSTPPPYRGGTWNSEQVEHGKEDVKPSETSPPGALNIEYVRERLAAEDYKAIYRHCQVNRLDYDDVLEAARAVTL